MEISWISAKERLPDPSIRVLFCAGEWFFVGHFKEMLEGDAQLWVSDEEAMVFDPDWWFPIPALPDKEP